MLGSLCDLSSLDARLSLWHGSVFGLVGSLWLIGSLCGMAWLDAWGTGMLGVLGSLGFLGFLRMPWFGTYLSLVDGCVWDPFGLSLVPSHDLSLFWLIGSRVSLC